MDIKDAISESWRIAEQHGFKVPNFDDADGQIAKLALVHSEVSEAVEAVRNGDFVNYCEELADICIRIFHICGVLNIDLSKAISNKLLVNVNREHMHGKLA